MSTSQPSQPDYSLYLVTDVTAPILGQRDLVTQVRNALAGGATIVQHRDKTSSTATLIRDARALHTVTKQYGIPLLINDRVDVALAIGCEGVHLGQDDMSLATARKILGADKIIGITASNATEATDAVKGGADYVGIGTMFGTQTKKDTKDIIGPGGTQAVLAAMAEAERVAGRRIGAVAIGGINASNVQRVMYQSASQSPVRPLDGVAVVSAIMASDDAKWAAGTLRRLIAGYEEAAFATLVYPPEVEAKDLIEAYLGRDVPQVIKKVRETKPLCHNMTNLVVQNFAANVALAIGGSPIMANDGAEAADLAKLGGSLVINMGSATPGAVEQALKAVQAYNAAGGPVLLDPVGAAATEVRRKAVRALLAGGYFDLIKGNESEILFLSNTAGGGGSGSKQRGVDSGDSGLGLRQKADVVRELAERQRCVVLMTGKEDLLSDGVRVLKVGNGHSLLGEITGSGCTLGTTLAAMLAVEKQDKLLAAVSGLLLYEIAAEEAATASQVEGPGSFVPAFIDRLSRNSKVAAGVDSAADLAWLSKAKVEPVNTQINGTTVTK